MTEPNYLVRMRRHRFTPDTSRFPNTPPTDDTSADPIADAALIATMASAIRTLQRKVDEQQVDFEKRLRALEAA